MEKYFNIYRNREKMSDIKFASVIEALDYLRWITDEWRNTSKLSRLSGPRTSFFIKDENDVIRLIINSKSLSDRDFITSEINKLKQ